MEKNRKCTHCLVPIECNTQDVTNCDCSKIKISTQVQNFLAGTYHKCLCNSCLQKFEQMVDISKDMDFPARRSQMVEGVHYYIENGYFVFTELYHFLKGQCCQNGCRHCVYGFKNRYL